MPKPKDPPVDDSEKREKARDAAETLAGQVAAVEYDLQTAEDALEERLALEEIEMRKRLMIEPTALEEEFIRCSGDIAFVAGQHSRRVHAHLVARIREKRLRGLLTLKHRNNLIAAGSKATVGEVEAAVDMDPDYIQAKLDEATAEALREDGKGKLLAALAKKDMLVQMGANFRAEMERDPVIRERHRAARSLASEGDWAPPPEEPG